MVEGVITTVQFLHRKQGETEILSSGVVSVKKFGASFWKINNENTSPKVPNFIVESQETFL